MICLLKSINSKKNKNRTNDFIILSFIIRFIEHYILYKLCSNAILHSVLVQFSAIKNNKKRTLIMKISKLLVLLSIAHVTFVFSGPPIDEDDLAKIRAKIRQRVEENRIKEATMMPSYKKIIGNTIIAQFLSTTVYTYNEGWSLPHQETKKKLITLPLDMQEYLIELIGHKRTLLHIDYEDRSENYKLNALQSFIQQNINTNFTQIQEKQNLQFDN